MLETQRLVLRPATITDAAKLVDLNSDKEVIQFTGDSSFCTILEAEALLRENFIPQHTLYRMGRFLMFLKDGTFIGWCGLKYFPDNHEVDVGYRLKKKYWGQGFATEASMACLEYGFKTLKLDKIIGRSMPENIASIKVFQKCKMTFRGLINDPTMPPGFLMYDIKSFEFKT